MLVAASASVNAQPLDGGRKGQLLECNGSSVHLRRRAQLTLNPVDGPHARKCDRRAEGGLVLCLEYCALVSCLENYGIVP